MIKLYKSAILIFVLFITLISATNKKHPINKNRVIANPIDIDYLFDARSGLDMSKMDFSFLLKSMNLPKDLPKLDKTTTKTPTPEMMNLVLAHDILEQKPMPVSAAGSRTAADPVCRFFNNKYYLFYSGADGYWASDDMQNWNHIETEILPAGVAPSIMIFKNEMYYVTSDINKIFKTATPEDGTSWKLVTDHFRPFRNNPKGTAHDPYLFADDNGRVYFYWECSAMEPIKGIELDPKNNFETLCDPVVLINFDWEKYGSEVSGDNNELYFRGGYSEGAIMTKYNGKYYLQYATCGTEWDAYNDGLYVSDSPLGPFTHAKTSPVSLKLAGFVTGAGHGDTFQDKYGNWWHLSTNKLSQRQIFERRISLYPLIFTGKGNMYALTEFTDYPMMLPNRKVDFLKESILTGWMNLSIDKQVKVSSELEGFEAKYGADNRLANKWWAAKTGSQGEWIEMDLAHQCEVYAIQPNFADHDFKFNDTQNVLYKYVIEGSSDGNKWSLLVDKSKNTTKNPHSLIVLDKPAKIRYIRVTNRGQLPGNFSMYALRVFGFGQGKAPAQTKITSLERNEKNRRRIVVNWEKNPNATGYLVRWGADRDELYTSVEVYGQNSVDLGVFDRDEEYYFSIDPFNEIGVTKGEEIYSVK